MKILVTGAGGFIGRNLCVSLESRGYDVMKYHHEQGIAELEKLCNDCEFIFHLAGVNRPNNEADFWEGNASFTANLLQILSKQDNVCSIVYASSKWADTDSLYGISKRKSEELLRSYGQKTHAEIYIYRLPNVFGKWCRPNYNSVVATFCHNVAHNLPLIINDAKQIMTLTHVDDVMEEFLDVLTNKVKKNSEFYNVKKTYTSTIGNLAETISSFSKCRYNLTIPNQFDDFTKKLYSTYLTYLPREDFSYELSEHCDSRGSFTEFLKSKCQGQISVNITHPHVVKGNHWHHSKHEKFLVVHGEGVIRFRNIFENESFEYHVSGNKLEVVEIPAGYTHNIENIGDTDLITLMWANEPFDPDYPDTFSLEV